MSIVLCAFSREVHSGETLFYQSRGNVGSYIMDSLIIISIAYRNYTEYAGIVFKITFKEYKSDKASALVHAVDFDLHHLLHDQLLNKAEGFVSKLFSTGAGVKARGSRTRNSRQEQSDQ